MNKISVIVPTWKRPLKLEKCLTHLKQQTVWPSQIFVILRSEDLEARKIVESFQAEMPNLLFCIVEKPGVIAAENCGLKNVHTELVAFIDDDGYAPKDWIERILNFFNQYPEACALGGPDVIVSEPWTYYDFKVNEVGQINWFGKIIGNHHRMPNFSLKEVDILKGVNMTFKRNSFSFLDERLSGIDGNKGNGSQWELDICLTLKKSNKKIYYDPELLVNHDSDHKDHIRLESLKNNSHNLTYVILKHFRIYQIPFFLLYALLIGNEQLPGIVKLIYSGLKNKDFLELKIYWYKLKGFFLGIKTYADFFSDSK